MQNWQAVLMGGWCLCGWPLVWVGVTVYLMRYGSPIAWRGMFRARDAGDADGEE